MRADAKRPQPTKEGEALGEANDSRVCGVAAIALDREAAGVVVQLLLPGRTACFHGPILPHAKHGTSLSLLEYPALGRHPYDDPLALRLA